MRASPATLGNGNKKRSNAVSVAFSEALLADAGHNRPTIFDAKANHNTYSVANIGLKKPKPNRGHHSNHIKNSKNELPPLGEGWGGAANGLPPLGEGRGGATNELPPLGRALKN